MKKLYHLFLTFALLSAAGCNDFLDPDDDNSYKGDELLTYIQRAEGGSAQRLRLRPERQPDQRHDGRGDGQRRVEHLVGQCFPQYRQRRVELHEQSVRQVVVGLHGHRLLQPVFR